MYTFNNFSHNVALVVLITLLLLLLLCNSECFAKYDTFCSHIFNYACLRHKAYTVPVAVELNTVWDLMGTVWDRMEPYGHLWNRMALWDRMGTYETVWALMGPYGHRMGPCGLLWDCMGTVWALIEPYGHL